MTWDLLSETSRLGVRVSLAAIPYSLVYTQLRVLNYAFGELITFGAYTLLVLVGTYHLPIWLAIICALFLTGALGALIEVVAYRRLIDSGDRHLFLVSSVGVSIVLQNCYQAVFGSRTLYLNAFGYGGVTGPLVLLLEVAVLLCLLNYTSLGDRIAAVASSRDLAQIRGIDHRFVYSAIFMLASALAVPASFLELADNGVAPDMGFHVGLLAFAACVLGGLGSILRPVAASFVLAAIVEAAQSTGTLNDRIWWVGFVLAAILIAAGRRILLRRKKILVGMDTGQ